MFSQQHQFQQQLLQIQQLIQQQQQQQQQQHPPPTSAGRGLSPQQQQQILNLRATGQASLLNSNPMLQRALLMQHMQAGRFNMTAPGLQHFFPRATQHSLLGPPPVNVSLKPAHIGFPGLPFQRQNRGYRKESLKGPPDQKKDELGSSSQTPSEDEKIDVPESPQEEANSQTALPEDQQTPPEPSDDGTSEPLAKRLKSVQDTPDPKEETGLTTEKEEQAAEADPQDTSKDWKVPEEPKSLEVMVSSGSSLKVTIQQRSESRAISTTAPKPGARLGDSSTPASGPEPGLKFFCYICKINCVSQQNFQAHMAGLQHQQRLGEIQHMSNACLLSLLPTNREQGALAERDGEPQSQRWCNTCQIHFLGDLIKHRRTQEHKLAKHSLRPFCTACSRHFKTPRKFVEHMKSPEHKQKAKEARLGEKEPGSPEEAEELITVDAVGCFEEDEEEEEEEEMMLPGMEGKEEPGSDSGTTAVVALIRGKQLIVANAGDSRCVVSEAGKALDMSYDHKPEDELELARIKNAGGKVTMDGRVNGGLNLSRAIGDHFYKRNKNLPPEEQMISALPDIKVLTLNEDHDFMVIACDGIWNVMSSQEVVDFIQAKISQRDENGELRLLSSIVEELLDQCLAPDTSGDGTGCDNMTCIIICFKPRSTATPPPESGKRRLEEVVPPEATGENGSSDNSKKAKQE